MDRNLAAVVGTGQMGRQLALFLMQKEYQVIVKSRSKKGEADAKNGLLSILTKLHGSESALGILTRASFTSDFRDIASCPLVFESVVESYSIKMPVLSEISSSIASSAIIATNTSSLSISKLSGVVANPERFLGVHFFNPVHKMKLVELVRGKRTSDKSIQRMREMVVDLDKTPIVVQDTPGFIVNRLLLPLINESVILVEGGAAPADVDLAVRLGLNYPMGPLELADLIGIDTCVSILRTLKDELRDGRYTPARLLLSMMEKGDVGRKVGKGFYDYKQKP